MRFLPTTSLQYSFRSFFTTLWGKKVHTTNAIADDRIYLPTHQWLQPEGEGLWRMGITPFAAEQLGDVVFVELPDREVRVNEGETLFVVESVKTASDVAAPVDLEVLDVNRALHDHPEWLNEAPLDHWIVLFRAEKPIDPEKCLAAETYAQQIAAER